MEDAIDFSAAGQFCGADLSPCPLDVLLKVYIELLDHPVNKQTSYCIIASFIVTLHHLLYHYVIYRNITSLIVTLRHLL